MSYSFWGKCSQILHTIPTGHYFSCCNFLTHTQSAVMVSNVTELQDTSYRECHCITFTGPAAACIRAHYAQNTPLLPGLCHCRTRKVSVSERAKIFANITVQGCYLHNSKRFMTHLTQGGWRGICGKK